MNTSIPNAQSTKPSVEENTQSGAGVLPPESSPQTTLSHAPLGAELVTWSEHNAPFNPRFQDIYRSTVAPGNAHLKDQGDENTQPKDLGLEQARHVFLAGCGLSGDDALWRDQTHWSILESGFGLGVNFLACYQAWSLDPRRPQHLHYCAIEAYPVSSEDLEKSASAFGELGPFTKELLDQYWGLGPGFHRLTLAQGHVHLTLCIGQVQDMLPQIQAHFDSIFLDGFDPQKNPQMWSELTMKGIASRAKWGARAATWSVSAQVRNNLTSAGFVCEKRPGLPPKREALRAVYAPPWREQMLEGRPSTLESPSLSSTGAHPPQETGEVLIIGAGLAGASLAHSLATRGVRVRVIDSQRDTDDLKNRFASDSDRPHSNSPLQTKALEQGAQGLPFALFHPMNSRDDNLQSKMTRSGIRVLLSKLHHLKSLKAGESFLISGVLEKKKASSSKKSKPLTNKETHKDKKQNGDPITWPSHWSRAPQKEELHWLMRNDPSSAKDWGDSEALFHEKAGWIDVPAFICALLDHPLITLHTNEEVTQLVYRPGLGLTWNKERSTPLTLNPMASMDPSAIAWQVKTRSMEKDTTTHDYSAAHVVLCSSVATPQLLKERISVDSPDGNRAKELLMKTVQSWPLQAIKGQLTLGWMSDLSLAPNEDPGSSTGSDTDLINQGPKTRALPTFAVNGQSSWMGGLGNATSLENLTPKGLSNDTMKSPDSLFCMGASYERDMKQVVNSASVRESNVRKLSELMPQLKLSSSAQLMDWSGTRSTCQDRLPLVGPVSSELEGLWVLSALGSRGLSMSVMLAEHLSSLMTLEPSPLPKRLSQAIDPKRFLP